MRSPPTRRRAGAVIRSGAHCASLYDFAGAALGDAAARAGIPTGTPIPTAAADLVVRAFPIERGVFACVALRHAGTDALLARARALIAAAGRPVPVLADAMEG